MATDNVTKEREEQLKKEHPERVVDGVYYEDDTELESAKKAYEEKLKKAQDEAAAKATAKAQSDAQALKTINELLYGENSQLTQEQLEATVGGIELNAVLGNSLEVMRRQRLLDPTKYMTEFKSPNPGKMPNNMDAFPVDLKIEELESHQPKVKFYRIETHTDGEPGAYAALMLSDLVEKRLVHLENNFATIMRLLFRLGARIHVNCVYWGLNDF